MLVERGVVFIPIDEVFADDLSVTQGNPTKASEYNNLSDNTDALKQRVEMDHWFNNTGVADEDGHHKGDWDDPTWMYAKDTGGAYGALFLDDSGDGIKLRIKTGTSKVNATPANETDGDIVTLTQGPDAAADDPFAV